MGQFILTGSAVPPDLDNSLDTSMDRIARLKMRIMSLYETRESNGRVSLRELFEEGVPNGSSQKMIEELALWICRGGWA